MNSCNLSNSSYYLQMFLLFDYLRFAKTCIWVEVIDNWIDTKTNVLLEHNTMEYWNRQIKTMAKSLIVTFLFLSSCTLFKMFRQLNEDNNNFQQNSKWSVSDMTEVDNWLWLFNVVRYFSIWQIHKRSKLIWRRPALKCLLIFRNSTKIKCSTID